MILKSKLLKVLINLKLPQVPIVRNKELIPNLSRYHFQYAYGLEGIKSDFSNTRIQNIKVSQDIYKHNKKKKSFSYCESCPMDGYISWRLSTMKNINLFAIEYLRKNVEKIQLLAKIFNYNIKTFHGSVDSYKDEKFDVLTMLGCTYQMSHPLRNIHYAYNTHLKDCGVLYFDMKHYKDGYVRVDEQFVKKTSVEGLEGSQIKIVKNYTKEKQDFMSNHPIKFNKTIIYSEKKFKEYLFRKFPGSSVFHSNDNKSFSWNIYKICK